MLIQVSLSLNIFENFTYNYIGDRDKLKKGMRIVIPIGNRVTTGWVIDKDSEYKGRIKNVIGIIEDEYLPDEDFLNFARSISQLYFTSIGMILDYSLSPKRRPINNIYFEKNEQLEKMNKFSATELCKLSEKRAINFIYKNKGEINIEENVHSLKNFESKENRLIISYERADFYKDIIDFYIQKHMSVLIAVPDNLTASYLKSLFKDVSIYNSSVKLKDREKIWCDCLNGKIGVVTGGISAVFLPIKNLGCIICERAGSSFYKSSYFSNLNINVLSKVRAKKYGLPFIEGASHSTVEAYKNRDQLFIEDKRGKKDIYIDVKMLKVREKSIPAVLIELLKAYFLDNKRILVVLNKKVSFSYLFCKSCKVIQRCPVCKGILRVEKDFKVKCTKCDFEKEKYNLCSKCNKELVLIKDMSIITLEEIIKKQIDETNVLTLSSESIKDISLTLQNIKKSKIVISTPVILNPFFKNIFDSIIYIRPESIFNMHEYNASEMIFSIVSELKELVKKGGNIDIFSTFHFHYSLKLINNEEDFFERELKYRNWFLLPPYSYVYKIEIRAKNLRELGKDMRLIFNKFRHKLNLRKIYLVSRKKIRGNYKGEMKAHSIPESILNSGLLKKRNVNISLEIV